MRELTAENITDAVLEQMATTADPRMKAVMACAVRHLHDFAREMNLTPAEWIKGIEFMTAVGKKCTPERQEFILLSDTLGLSALVNAMHDKTAIEDATHSSLLGPFYRETTPRLERGAQISKNADSNAIVMWGRVTDIKGAPVANADVSVWQTGDDGLYDIQVDPTSTDLRGVFTTDANGVYCLRSVVPIGYSIPMDGPVGAMVRAQGRHGMRPAHVHFLITAPGFRELVTATYIKGDKYLADDVVFGSAADLVAELRPHDPDCPVKGQPSIRFDFSMAREGAVDKQMGRVGSDPAAIMRA
jgi:hydroxyquinol 1,2-dioxygenase